VVARGSNGLSGALDPREEPLDMWEF